MLQDESKSQTSEDTSADDVNAEGSEKEQKAHAKKAQKKSVKETIDKFLNENTTTLKQTVERLEKMVENFQISEAKLKEALRASEEDFKKAAKSFEVRANEKLKEHQERVNQKFRAEMEHTLKFGAKKVLSALLEPLGQLEKAMEFGANSESPEVKNYVLGFKMIMAQINEALLNAHVTTIAPQIGEVFDHNIHEAIGYEENAAMAHKIVKVAKNGYKLHHLVLSPAKVIVGKEKTTKKEESNG